MEEHREGIQSIEEYSERLGIEEYPEYPENRKSIQSIEEHRRASPTFRESKSIRERDSVAMQMMPTLRSLFYEP